MARLPPYDYSLKCTCASCEPCNKITKKNTLFACGKALHCSSLYRGFGFQTYQLINCAIEIERILLSGRSSKSGQRVEIASKKAKGDCLSLELGVKE